MFETNMPRIEIKSMKEQEQGQELGVGKEQEGG